MRLPRRLGHSRDLRRRVIVVAVGVAATAVACGAYQADAFRRVELASVDARFGVRGHRSPPSNLVIVKIDDPTIHTLGRWPLSRSLHADAIRRISRDRPQVIAYDVQFTESGPSRRADNALLDAVAAARHKVVLATTEARVSPFLRRFAPFASIGNTGLPNDPGAVLRRLPYSVGDLKAFALVATEVATQRRIERASLGGDEAWIDYDGPPGTVATVPFARVVADGVPRGYFAGRIVIVGAVAPSLQDLHTTSVSGREQMTGPEIVANAISTAMRGFPLRSAGDGVNLVLIAALSLLIPLANMRFRLGFALAGGAAAAGAFLVAAQLAFDAGSIVAVAYPLSGMALAAIALLGVRYAMAVVDARRPDVDSTGQLRPGAVLAGYRTERLLGRGGGGSVYLATEISLRRKVAVKVLNPELASDDEFRARFLHESQVAAALDHPHVVPIYGAGEHAGRLFVAMRWVRASLAGLLTRDGMLEPARAVAVVEQVADALDAAHEHGLVHRDVSPSNILLDPPRLPGGADHAYLADFGLALHRGLTAAGERVGKPDYVAPEQIRGEAVDGRADLYSLGCVLYECLVGEPPFAGSSEIGVIGRHLSEQPPSASARRPGLPPAVDPVLARAMAKVPAERYETCVAFAAAMRLALLDRVPEPSAAGVSAAPESA